MTNLPDNFEELMRAGVRVEITPGFYIFKSYADRVEDGDIVLCDDCGHGVKPDEIHILPSEEQAPNWTHERKRLCADCHEEAILRLRRWLRVLDMSDDEFEAWLEDDEL